MKPWAGATSLVAVITLLAACGSDAASSSTPAGVAMVVNGASTPVDAYTHIVTSELQKLEARGLPVDTKTVDGKKKETAIRVSAIRELVSETVLMQMAAQRKVQVPESEVTAAIAQLQADLGGPAALQQKLDAAVETTADLRKLVQLNRLRTKLHDADPGFDAAFDKAVKNASAQIYVEPCTTNHAYPGCLG